MQKKMTEWESLLPIPMLISHQGNVKKFEILTTTIVMVMALISILRALSHVFLGYYYYSHLSNE